MDNCHIYGSTLDGMRKIVRQEGAGVLWRGTDVALLMAVPMVSSFTLLLAFIHSILGHEGQRYRLSLPMVCTWVSTGSSALTADAHSVLMHIQCLLVCKLVGGI